MRRAEQGAGTVRHATCGERAAPASRWGTFLKAQLGGLALVIGSLVMAAPAHAVSGEPTQAPAAQTSAVMGFGQTNALLPGAAHAGRLPFERHDLAILMFGAAIVVLAAAGAPFLLRPLRGLQPALTEVTASDPILPAVTVASAAHVTA